MRQLVEQLQEKYQLKKWYIDLQEVDDAYIMVDRWHYYPKDHIAILRYNPQYPKHVLETGIAFRMREMAMRFVEIHTKRLFIRHMEDIDFESEWILQSNPNVSLSDGYAPLQNKQDLMRKLQQMIADPGCFSICLNGTSIGHMSLRFVQRACVAIEIGYAIQEAYWKQGYGYEAVSAIIDMCFQHLDVDMVIASCFIDNKASKRVMEKCNMQYVGCLRKAYGHDLYGALDLLTYSIVKEEYK